MVLLCAVIAFASAPEPLTVHSTDADTLPIFVHPWLFRAHGSAGLSRGAAEDESFAFGLTSGVQLMLPANAQQSYGVQVDFVQTDTRDETRYVAAGLLIEQRTFGFLLASIGGVGYIPVEGDGGVPFGITTRLGYAPDLGTVSPFIALRSDWIFRSDLENLVSVDLGLTLKLD